MSGRRCICGRASSFPLCDGAHAVEGWTCTRTRTVSHPQVFASGPAYHSVVERLAHAHRASALHQLRGPIRTEALVVVTDGTDHHHLRPALQRVDAETTRVLAVGADPLLLGGAFPGAAIVPVAEADQPTLLWRNLSGALHRAVPLPSGVVRVFLSHATADEPRLQPAIEALRALGLEVFSCGDSIPGGSRWWDEILSALRACDRFVLVLSPAARQSTWCAFEAGAAIALEKPLQVISLDGAPPPSFLAHIQMQDVPRVQVLHPWLTPAEALLEALLAPIPNSSRG